MTQMTQMDADFIATIAPSHVAFVSGRRVSGTASDFVVTSPCHHSPRPSGPLSASQRRTIGAVARTMIEGLRPRRWHAGGLPRSRERCTGRRLPEVAPLDVVRRENHCVGGRQEQRQGRHARCGVICPQAQMRRGFGWRSRQVMALTSSKSWIDSFARRRSMAPA